MPLPPAPGRRAARLSPEAYENKVNPARASSRTVTAEPEEVTETIALEATTAAAPMRRRARNTAEAATKAAAPAVATPKSTTSTRQAAAKKAISNTPVTASNGSQGKSLPRSKKTQGPAKLFVLDTNVLLHDPTSLFRFEEHDIFLPMIVLEELDAHKKGMTEVARNGRQTSRTHWMRSRESRGRTSDAGSSWIPQGSVPPVDACTSRPHRWTTACPPASQLARPTTRFWALWRLCPKSTHRAKWYWFPKTSTCASRRVRWG